MAQYKSRPLAAFLLLITVGSLLTASESVQLSEGMKRLSMRGRSPSPKRGRFESGDEGTSTMSPSVAARQQELGLLRPEERLIAGQAKAAALQTVHQLGAVALTPEQAKAALLDEILRATQNLDLRKYENLNTEQQKAYEQVQRDLSQLSPETKALLIENQRKEKTLLEKARKLFQRRHYHVTKQAALAGQILNEQRDASGALQSGAVKTAIQRANEQYNVAEEDKNFNEEQHASQLKKVGAMPSSYPYDVPDYAGAPKKKRKANLLTVHQNLPALPVDATSDEVRKNLMDMFRDRQAFSEHTWKMLLSVCRSWAAWCKLNNRKWFPAEPEDVRDYLLYLQARGLAVKTIQQHLGQLNMLHRRSGLPRPSDSNAVSLVMRRIRKENVDAGERAKQALAFERTDFDQVRSLMENSDRCQDIRNLAFLGIAYNTLLRIAEIARIRVKDISRTDGGRMLIHIGRTKTLVSTAGVEKALSLGVTKLVERWISVSGVADDPNNYLFCRVRKNGVAAPSATSQLSTRALEGIFEATHRLIYGAKDDSGQRYLAWSGHSARVGAARDMARAGVSIPEIMQAGGWTNVNIVMNYIRNLDSETGAMVRLLEDGDSVRMEQKLISEEDLNGDSGLRSV